MNRRFWNWVRNEDGTRTLTLNGTIAEESWFEDDVTPRMFRDELNAGTGDVVIWINSPGGDCVAASQIYTMLMDYKGHITVKMNRVIANKEQVLADIRALISTLTDTHELEEKEVSAAKELEAVSESMRKLVDDYARALIEQAAYDDRYAELLAQSRMLEKRIAQICEQREQRKARKRELDAFYKVLKETGPILEFDEELWNIAVEKVIVRAEGNYEFIHILNAS